MKFLYILLMFLVVGTLSAAGNGSGGHAKNHGKNANSKPRPEEVLRTKEIIELEELQSGTKRSAVLGIMVELVKKLDANKDLPAVNYEFYISRMNAFLADKYLELNTQLDRKWFAKIDTLLKAMRDNKNWRASNQVNGKNVHPKYPAKMAQFNSMKKKLKAWTDKPDEPSAAVIKAQQKAKKARIKELQKIIAKQKEEAKRRARQSAGQ